MSSATPWRRWLAAGFAAGVAPAAFWRLSVREWRALSGSAAEALDRAGLLALAAQYPDAKR